MAAFTVLRALLDFGCLPGLFALTFLGAATLGNLTLPIFFIGISMNNNDYSEWDDAKFGIGFPLLILGTIGLFALAIVLLFV